MLNFYFLSMTKILCQFRLQSDKTLETLKLKPWDYLPSIPMRLYSWLGLQPHQLFIIIDYAFHGFTRAVNMQGIGRI